MYIPPNIQKSIRKWESLPMVPKIWINPDRRGFHGFFYCKQVNMQVYYFFNKWFY